MLWVQIQFATWQKFEPRIFGIKNEPELQPFYGFSWVHLGGSVSNVNRILVNIFDFSYIAITQ